MPGEIGKYQIGRTLGSGASCKVKLGVDSTTGKKVAVKIMKENMDQADLALIKTEVEALQGLKHINIVEQVEVGNGQYVKQSGKKRQVDYIVLELAAGGELFDFIAISGAFDEPTARYYFKQFMEGLAFCHENGICHRDLKPENLLLDELFCLKIADFGFAAPVAGKDGQGYLFTKLGTQNYMAPEIHLKQPYQGPTVDIFAAAIILFIMVSAHPPFTTAVATDPFYRCLAANRADVFWKTHSKNKPGKEGYFSEEFKDLIQAMLQLEANHRPSISDILAHPWLKGEVKTQEEIVQNFQERNNKVQASLEADKQEKAAEKQKRMTNRDKAMRSGGNEESKDEDLLPPPKKAMDDYVSLYAQNTEFFSSYHPDMIEQALHTHIRSNEQIEPVVNEKKYKTKFTLESMNNQSTEICVRLFKVSDEKVCVEFQMLKGDKTRFNEHFTDYKNNVLGFANDTN